MRDRRWHVGLQDEQAAGLKTINALPGPRRLRMDEVRRHIDQTPANLRHLAKDPTAPS